MHTTLNRIKVCEPCERGWNAIVNYVGTGYGMDEPISFNRVLDAVGLLGAIWCLRTVVGFTEQKAEFDTFCNEGPHTQEEITLKFLELFGD